ncbi:hypothetical protein WDW89_02445 [Deltaproteobacteria bacterium TL4]
MKIKAYTILQFLFLLFLSALFVSSCGEDKKERPNDGAVDSRITFELRWPDTSSSSATASQYRIFPIPSNVDTVRMVVLNAAGEIARSGAGDLLEKDFDSNTGVGFVEGVPAGEGYTVRFVAFDSQSFPRYRAAREEVTVVANTTTKLGTIDMDVAHVNSSAVVTKTVQPGEQCPFGGVQIEMGIDRDGSGTLDEKEVTKFEVVCNGIRGPVGASGAIGVSTLLNIEEILTDDTECGILHGKKIEYGKDDNNNGILEPVEVDTTSYICNATAPGLSINRRSLFTNELGASDGFTLRLNSKPTNDVIVKIENSNSSEVKVFPDQVVVTPDNWQDSQPVTVTGVRNTTTTQDQIVQLTLSFESEDVVYKKLDPLNVSVTNVHIEPPAKEFSSHNELVSTLAGSFTEDDIKLFDGIVRGVNNGYYDNTLYLFATDSNNHIVYRININTHVIEVYVGKKGFSGNGVGSATNSRFKNPRGITIDSSTGFLYVVDSGNGRIIRIDTDTPTAGTTALVNMSGSLNEPWGITLRQGTLNITEIGAHRVRTLSTAGGSLGVLAGDAVGYADGSGGSARFNKPKGIHFDGTNFFVADSGNHAIRQITLAGVVTTVAGIGTTAGAKDGDRATALFDTPVGITGDSTYLYVSAQGQYPLRKIEKGKGATSTLVQFQGSLDGGSSIARFNDPSAILCDDNTLYISTSNRFRKLDLIQGTIITMIGRSSTNGSGTSARFDRPVNLVAGPNGKIIYITDYYNHTIRTMNLTSNAVGTLAGVAGKASTTEAAVAPGNLFFPWGLTSDGTYLYVTEPKSHTIRRVSIDTGVTKTIGGTAFTHGSSEGIGTTALFNTPYGIATDLKNLYVADSENHVIRKMDLQTFRVSIFAGDLGTPGSSGGVSSAQFNQPKALTSDGVNLYVIDQNGIRIVEMSSGKVSTISGTSGLKNSLGLSSDGINLYVSDTDHHQVQKVVIKTGAIAILAGNNSEALNTDTVWDLTYTPMITTPARFHTPAGILFGDLFGTDKEEIFLVDAVAGTLRKMAQQNN